MKHQTTMQHSLGLPRSGAVRTLALAVTVMLAGALPLLAQAPAAETKPAAAEAKPAAAKKAAPAEHMAGKYRVHQMIELGGRITETSGNEGMWNTLVNLGSGGSILGQSLEMHSSDPSKTPFFDTLSTSSAGYGGDPTDTSYLRVSKGRIYDFSGTFRRDRQYFDYNLLANSFNSQTANTYGLVPETSSPHLFNTVRRNTDLLATLAPLSRISVRAGYNRNHHLGPSYSSVHEGADALLLQNWDQQGQNFLGGVDVKLTQRTVLSYDQFYVRNQNNTTMTLAGLNAKLPNGTPVSYGLDPGSGSCPGVVGGVGLAKCNGYLSFSSRSPTRTNFPTEQLRLSSHEWDRVSVVGRVLYSGAKTTITSLNQTYNGLTTRTYTRQEIDTGAGTGGQFGWAKRNNLNADLSLTAELNRWVELSEQLSFWNFRMPGANTYTSQVWAGTKSSPPTLLTPLSALTPTTTSVSNTSALNQKVGENTFLVSVTVVPEVKLSGGYRFRSRRISNLDDNMTWHENWLLMGAAVTPSPAVRINVNYEWMRSKNESTTGVPSDTYTRLAPDALSRFRARTTVKPYRWLNLSAAGAAYVGKNNDPLVNHNDHMQNLSLAAQISPSEVWGLDFNLAHEDVYSVTDICYVSGSPLAGASNSGTCTAANGGGASYMLGNAYYDAPTTFFSSAIRYTPGKNLHLFGGFRLNRTKGNAELLNPNMIPGALDSKFLSPFADVEFHVAREWSWHGNWMHTGYKEAGDQGLLLGRDTHGDVLTLGVKYAF